MMNIFGFSQNSALKFRSAKFLAQCGKFTLLSTLLFSMLKVMPFHLTSNMSLDGLI